MGKTQVIDIQVVDMDTGDVTTGYDVLIGGNGEVLMNNSMFRKGNFRVHITVRPDNQSTVSQSITYCYLNKGTTHEVVQSNS